MSKRKVAVSSPKARQRTPSLDPKIAELFNGIVDRGQTVLGDATISALLDYLGDYQDHLERARRHGRDRTSWEAELGEKLPDCFKNDAMFAVANWAREATRHIAVWADCEGIDAAPFRRYMAMMSAHFVHNYTISSDRASDDELQIVEDVRDAVFQFKARIKRKAIEQSGGRRRDQIGAHEQMPTVHKNMAKVLIYMKKSHTTVTREEMAGTPDMPGMSAIRSRVKEAKEKEWIEENDDGLGLTMSGRTFAEKLQNAG